MILSNIDFEILYHKIALKVLMKLSTQKKNKS